MKIRKYTVIALLASASMASNASLQVVSPDSSFLFDETSVGAISPPTRFVLRNTGTAPLVIEQMQIDSGVASCAGPGCSVVAKGDFMVVPEADTCSPSVGAGATCAVEVRFAPNGDGMRAARLVVQPSHALPTTFVLRGAGEAGSTAMDPAECVMNWAEREFLDASARRSATISGPFFRARCYDADSLCLGTEMTSVVGAPAQIYVLNGSSGQAASVGPLSDWTGPAQCAGTTGPIDIQSFQYPYTSSDGAPSL